MMTMTIKQINHEHHTLKHWLTIELESANKSINAIKEEKNQLHQLLDKCTKDQQGYESKEGEWIIKVSKYELKVAELEEGYSKKLREIDKSQKDIDRSKAQVKEWKDKYYMLEYKYNLNR